MFSARVPKATFPLGFPSSIFLTSIPVAGFVLLPNQTLLRDSRFLGIAKRVFNRVIAFAYTIRLSRPPFLSYVLFFVLPFLPFLPVVSQNAYRAR